MLTKFISSRLRSLLQGAPSLSKIYQKTKSMEKLWIVEFVEIKKELKEIQPEISRRISKASL